jgi:Family of unknown function (DUF6785)/Domain of unknown function (DUF6784)
VEQQRVEEQSVISAVEQVAARRAARTDAPAAQRLWRGFLVGLVLLPPNAMWLIYLESFRGTGPHFSCISLFLNVIFIVACLALANAAVRRVAPWFALNRGELIVVYVMLTIGTSVAGHDMLQVLMPIISAGSWFANPQNNWDQILDGTTSPWLVVSDKSVLYGFWNGSATLYQRAVIEAWMTPILWWTGFAVVLVFVMICLCVLLRPLWAERERLTFPIIQLPLELADPETPLLRNRLLWIGFGAAALFDLVNGLSTIVPAVPSLPLTIDLAARLPDLPWSGVGWLPVTFYPAVIGLCFLMPLDLLFSCVVFFLWWKVLFVIAAATGISRGYIGDMSEMIFPWKNEQMFGGFIAIAISSPIIGRSYFRHVWRRIAGRPSEVDDRGEGLRFRTAAIGAVVGVGVLVWMTMHIGLSLGLAVAFFVTYYLLAVAVARVRAEFGSPVHDFHFTGPDYTLTQLLGTANLRPQDLGVFTQYFWFNRAYRGHPIADSIEGLQMANRTRTSPRAIIVALLLTTGVGLLVGFWMYAQFGYTRGISMQDQTPEWFGKEAYNRLQSWLEGPKPANLLMPFAMAAGFAITMLLTYARTIFAGWPLHPVAYALSASWSMHLSWMPMLLAWICKQAVLRYGGLRLYRRVLPLAYGVILGEAIVGGGWSLLSSFLHLPAYRFID